MRRRAIRFVEPRELSLWNGKEPGRWLARSLTYLKDCLFVDTELLHDMLESHDPE
jgi:hypothetical protein